MRRTVLKAVAALALLLAIVAAGGYHYLRRSLPQVDGTIQVAGLAAPIEIIRDADAIPHIIATSKLDGVFGLGYVHAQDRLWQMEFQRRIGHGRLSEILGAATVPQDRFLRTVGFARAARTAWASTPDWAKQQVNAYVAGVNAFITTHHGAGLPPEFTLLRFEPEPWTAVDVLVWVKMMAWDLSGNYSFELLRHDLLAVVGEARMAELMPPYAVEGLSILTGSDSPTVDTHQARQIHRGDPDADTTRWSRAFASALAPGDPHVRDFLAGASVEGVGSNNWVIDGTMTASGKPLLANDPHLGTRLPSTWYLAHISAGDFDVIGGTFPGIPAVALGRNRSIAWGATNVAADVEDLYREHVDATGTHAEFRGAQEPIIVIPETIIVKGAAPVVLNVRVTRHGPLISDAINANNADSKTTPRPPMVEPLAFRWTALDPDDATLPAFFKMNDARDWSEFTEALRGYVVPSQNFVFADTAGHIGYYAPGHIPIRASGDGSRPADGWTGSAEWTGWVPFEELPHLYDPPGHVIITANHRPAPASYPHNLGVEWTEPYRAQRIADLIHGHTSFTPDDFAHIQADTLSLHAKTLLPLLLAHARSGDPRDQPALDRLRQWNLDATADSAATAIFQAWFLHLTPALVADELGPSATDLYQGKFSFVARFLATTLATNDSPWCDDVTTPAHETCDDAVMRAFRSGIDDLQNRMGSDMARWRWDAVHRAMFPHALDSVAALRPILSRSAAIGGDWSTVNVGVTAADHPYDVHMVPGYREIIDLSSAGDSRFIDAIGESGHPLSAHYDDFIKDWQAVRHRKMRMDRADIDRGALGHLHLTP
ncbi:MAG: Penicillin amidase [Acidobacteria bacterium]|nr:Penicillin amidase [Acidobacteriota bacterium]